MSIIKLNNRSVKDATAFGSISSLGSLTFISKQTASSSATISFTSGIDSTYKEYIFYFVNCHAASNNGHFSFQGSTDGGSSYGVTMTTTLFTALHAENASYAALDYDSGGDLAQSTNFQNLSRFTNNDSDSAVSGYLHLFNPSSTTFVKHFVSRISDIQNSSPNWSGDNFIGGYFNTTSAIDAIQFKFHNSNTDSGDIILFGLN